MSEVILAQRKLKVIEL